MAAAEGRSLRRRLHAREAGPRAVPGGLRPLRRAARADARRRPLRGRSRRGARATSSATRSSTTTRRSGSRSPSGSCAAWAAMPSPRARPSPSSSRAAGTRHENFELYDDVLPVLDELRRGRPQARARLELGARRARVRTSTTRSTIDAGYQLVPPRQARSRTPRSSVPCSTCSTSSPHEAVMVGDTLEDDIEGARALGMQARPRRPAGARPRVRAAARRPLTRLLQQPCGVSRI